MAHGVWRDYSRHVLYPHRGREIEDVFSKLFDCAHSTENSVAESIPFQLSRQFRTDFGGIRVGPFKGKCPALVGFNGIDAAEVVIRQIGARAVWTTLENKTLAIGRDFRLALDERRFAHSEKRRDARDLRVRDAHDPVLDAAARPAHPALELVQFHLFAYALFSVCMSRQK